MDVRQSSVYSHPKKALRSKGVVKYQHVFVFIPLRWRTGLTRRSYSYITPHWAVTPTSSGLPSGYGSCISVVDDEGMATETAPVLKNRNTSELKSFMLNSNLLLIPMREFEFVAACGVTGGAASGNPPACQPLYFV